MEQLGIEELEQLLEEITKRVTIANQRGTLEELLKKMDMSDLIAQPCIEGRKDGKIVILGGSEIDEKHILITAGKLGIDKKRIECSLDYDNLQKYNYKKLQYSDNYRVVLVGPIPHSTVERGESRSIISEMESHPGMYPRVVRLTNGTELKITKNTLKKALEDLRNEDYI